MGPPRVRVREVTTGSEREVRSEEGETFVRVENGIAHSKNQANLQCAPFRFFDSIGFVQYGTHGD